MTAGEVAHRFRDQAVSIAERCFVYRRPSSIRAVLTNANQPRTVGRLTVEASDPDTYKRSCSAWANEIVEEAESYLRHEHDFLGVRTKLEDEIAWNQDYSTGRMSPRGFAKRIHYRFGCDYSAKHIWELNRHQHWVILGKAWLLTGRMEFPTEVVRQWDSWLCDNPPLDGLNWASGIEIGLRLVSWAYTSALLGPGVIPDDLWTRIVVSVHDQAQHLHRNQSHHSSANNHLVAEALGLYVAGCFFKMLRRARHWRSTGRLQLHESLKSLVANDGLLREQSSGYHQFAHDMWLIGGLIGRCNGDEFDGAYWMKLQRMLEFTCAAIDIRGNMPAIGDSDNSYVLLPTRPNSTSHPRRQLAVGGLLMSRPDFAAAAQSNDDWPIWLLGPSAGESAASMRALKPASATSRAFAESGLYVLRNGRRDQREVVIVVDIAPLGWPPLAAHGHADALSIYVSAGGWPLLIDPGTYTYHLDPSWRDYFRGTRAHNTLTVDGLDQSISAGPTFWIHHARAQVQRWSTSERADEVTGFHDGYNRIGGIIHTRAISYDKNSETIIVNDEVEGSGRHHVAMSFHLHPEARVTRRHRSTIDVARCDVRARIHLPQSAAVHIHIGRTDPISGWFSPSFGLKEVTSTIVASCHVDLPVNLHTTIGISWNNLT